VICDRALTAGAAAAAQVITEAMIDAAAGGLDRPQPGFARTVMNIATVALLAASILAGGGVAAWVFRDALSRTVNQWLMIPDPPQSPARSPMPLKPPPPPI
jgi:hypothetical protein